MNTPVDKIAEWLDWLSIDYAATTIAAYAWELRRLEAWAGRVLDRSVVDLSKADLARYLAQRRALDLVGDACVRRAVNAFRSFYSYAIGAKSPARSIPAPRVKKKRQRTLDGQLTLRLLSAPDTSSMRGRRDLALICLPLSTGLRASELCRLRLAELDMDARRLSTKVKGGDDGDGVFGDYTQSVMASWLAVRESVAVSGVDTVFVSVGGNRPGTSLTPSGLRVIFRRIGKEAGIEHLSPHDLRRTFATLGHRFGASTRLIQVAGRWKDIEQVVQYTRALEAEDFDDFDPVSRLMA